MDVLDRADEGLTGSAVVDEHLAEMLATIYSVRSGVAIANLARGILQSHEVACDARRRRRCAGSPPPCPPSCWRRCRCWPTAGWSSRPPAGRTALTPLGVWAVRRDLLREGHDAPTTAEVEVFADLSRAELVEAMVKGSATQSAVAGWLERRPPEEAARELIEIAADGTAGRRGAVGAILEELGPEAEVPVREALDRPLMRRYAASWLHIRDLRGPRRSARGDHTWIAVDSLAALMHLSGHAAGLAVRHSRARRGADQAGRRDGRGRPPRHDRRARHARRRPRRPGRGEGRPQSGDEGPLPCARRVRPGCPIRHSADCENGVTPLAIQPIRLFGDPVLRTPAAPVVDFDKELRKLVKDLTDTMMDAPGAGLAAPQIGVGLRVFTYYVDDQLGHLINPDLDLSEEIDEEGEEGCLSFPGLSFPTPRAMRAVAKGFNMHGEPVTLEGTDLMARCFQHETDHLDGILFIDRMDLKQRKLAMKAIREAEWSGMSTLPTFKFSPHATGGKASVEPCAWSSRARPRRHCRRCAP